MNKLKWLTVKEASLRCDKLGLPRSTKSLRRWCAKEEVEAQKRKIANTEKWFIDRASLEIKIKEELEFLKHSENSLPHSGQSAGHTADKSAHEQTQADASGHERSQADTSGRERTQPDGKAQQQIRDLEDQVLLLKNDIKWRDQVLKDQKNANEILMDEVKGQSRYIGHLETNVLRLGGSADQAFLAAPVPKSGVSEGVENTPEITMPNILQNEKPHPDQSQLYTG
jgi:hypothetical protein